MTQDLNLTTIAALPASGAGHVAAMRPECSRPRYQESDARLEAIAAAQAQKPFKLPDLRGQFLPCVPAPDPKEAHGLA